MDHHRISTNGPTLVTIGGTTFDHVVYDRGGDVLYLHVGEPSDAKELDATPEGHHTRYGPDGTLVGLTIVNARRLLESQGEIVVTLPERTVRAPDLGPVLAA